MTERPDAWPVIDGIDIELAKLRLGEPKLLLTLLRSFLLEFPAAGQTADAKQRASSPTPTETDLPDLAKHLHKLGGGAGQLGASKIHALATAAEAACREGNGTLVGALWSRLNLELERLHTAARQLPDTQTVDDSLPEPCASLSTSELHGLVQRLKDQDFAVLADMQALGRPLRASLGVERFTQVQAAIDALRFAEAARLLEAHVTSTRGQDD